MLFGLWGCEAGYKIEEAKRVVKEELGYTYVKNDRLFLESTADMNTTEMGEFITKFRNWSSQEHHCYLPSAEEYQKNYTEIDNTLQKHKIYL